MRRVLIVMAAVVFAAACLILPILAENDIYFTAINNTLLELNEKTMPVKQKGVFYVPNSVFNSSELGTYCIYSRSKQLVMISDLEHTLYFDMSEGTCYDDEGETYPYLAIYQNDTAYVPVLFTAYYYGIDYSYIPNDYAPIIRLTKGNALSDSAFLRGAAAIMETRLAQYQASLETSTATPSDLSPTPVETAEPTPTATPIQTPEPTPTPPPPVQPTASPKPDRSGISVFIAIVGLSEESENCADILNSKGCIPCFFIRTEEIKQYPALIRKLQGIGCGIGLLLTEDPEDEYAEASRLLREAAHSVTFLAAAEDELQPDMLRKVTNTGLRLWSAQKPVSDPDELYELLEQAESRCDLILDGKLKAEQVSKLLEHLISESYSICQITEMTETAFDIKQESW